MQELNNLSLWQRLVAALVLIFPLLRIKIASLFAFTYGILLLKSPFKSVVMFFAVQVQLCVFGIRSSSKVKDLVFT